MSYDPRFVITDPQNPGEIGAQFPAPGTFTHLQVNTDPTYPESIKVVVATPSTNPSPEGALNIQVQGVVDPNPGILVSHAGTGPGLSFDGTGSGPAIQLASGVTITEAGGQLVFSDTVAGTQTLASLVGGGGGSLTVGAVAATVNISANTTVTASNTSLLTDAAMGLIPYANAADFVANFLVYVGGQLMAVGLSASSNNDVYPAGVAANGEIAFEFSLVAGDVIQIVKKS